MLISEVINSASIALAATQDASNQIPYLGLQWFPERKKSGLDLKWIKTHKHISLKKFSYDYFIPLREKVYRKNNGKFFKIGIAFFK